MGDFKLIGKVGIKIMPDTSGFRDRVKAELEKAVEGLELNVAIIPDIQRVKEKADEARVEIEDALKGIVSTPELQTYDIEAEATKAKRVLDDILGVVRTDTELATDRLFADAKAAKDAIEARNKIELPVSLNEYNAIESALRMREKLKLALGDQRPDVNLHVDEISAAKTRFELDEITHDRIVKIRTDLETTSLERASTLLAALSGFRAFSAIRHDLFNMVTELDEAAPHIAALTLALGSMAMSATSGAANILGLSASIATIAPAALALPGMLGGVGIAFLTLKDALKDWNNELGDFSIGFGKKAKKMGDAWTDLGEIIKKNFWAEAKKPIREFLTAFLPEFTEAEAKLSTALGKLTGNLAGSLQTFLVGGALKAFYLSLDTAVSNLAKHTDSFASIFEELMQIGIVYLPKFTDYVGRLSDKFADWLNEVDSSGQVFDWIDTAIQAMKDFGGVVGNTARILGGLANAASVAGSTTLGSLDEMLSRAANAVNSTRFQNALSGVFAAAHVGFNNLANEVGSSFGNLMERLANTLSQVFPIVGKTLGELLHGIFKAFDNPVLQHDLVLAFQNIQRAVESLIPVLGPFALKLGSVLDGITALASNLAQAVAPMLIAAADGIQKIIPGFEELSRSIIPLGQALGPVLLGVKDAIAGILTSLSAVVTPLAHFFGILSNNPFGHFIETSIGFGIVIGGAAFAILNLIGKFDTFIAKLRETQIAVALASGEMIAMGEKASVAGTLIGAAKGAGGGKLGLALGLSLATDAAASLAPQASTAQKALSVLGDTASGAVTGAMIGSFVPAIGTTIGALVGGGIGGGFSLYHALNDTQDKLRDTKPAADAAAQALDDVKNAVDKTTGAFIKANILHDAQQAGIIDIGTKLHLSARDVVGALADEAGAQERVNAALDAYGQSLKGDDLTKFQHYLGTVHGALLQQQDDVRNANTQIADLGKQIAGLPHEKEIKLAFDQGKIQNSFESMQTLHKQLGDLTADEWKIVMRDVGFTPTIEQAKLLGTSLDALNKVQPDLGKFRGSLADQLTQINGFAAQSAQVIGQMIVSRLSSQPMDGAHLMGEVNRILQEARISGNQTAQDVAANLSLMLQEHLSPDGKHLNASLQQILQEALGQGTPLAQHTGDGLADFLGNGLGNVPGAPVANSVAGALTNAHASNFGLAQFLGFDLGGSLGQGVGNGISPAPMTSGMDNALSAFRNHADSGMAGAGESIMASLNRALSNWDQIKGTLNTLTLLIPGWKGPRPVDEVLLKPAGIAIIGGLITGFESMYGNVKDSLGSLTQAIGKTELDTTQFHSMGQAIGTAVADGIKSQSGTATEALTNLADFSESPSATLKVAAAAGIQNSDPATTKESQASIHIGEIKIPLEDLAQLQDLNEFMDLLRVRARQGVAA